MTNPRDPAYVAALVAKASDYWKAQRSRLTHVRRIVCEQAFATTSSFKADELLALARSIDRAISSASIYRTLSQLVEADLLRTVTGSYGEIHYTVVDAPAAGVSHIVCVDCKRVIPMTDPCLPLRESALAREHGFTPQTITLRVEASCEELRTRGSCDKAKPPAV